MIENDEIDDNLLRIGRNILKAAKIPYDKGCWLRAGVTDKELMEAAKKIIVTPEKSHVEASVQACALNFYIDELIVEGIIEKSDKRKYFYLWRDMVV